MANIERVKAVVEHMEGVLAKQPRNVINKLSFDMESWFEETKDANGNVCGTAMCFAGWGAHFAGLKMYETEDLEWGSREIYVATGETSPPTVEAWAVDFFGLSDVGAQIFYQTHIEDIEHLKASINYHLEEDVFEGVEDIREFAEL